MVPHRFSTFPNIPFSLKVMTLLSNVREIICNATYDGKCEISSNVERQGKFGLCGTVIEYIVCHINTENPHIQDFAQNTIFVYGKVQTMV